jgi:hypothetical protein
LCRGTSASTTGIDDAHFGELLIDLEEDRAARAVIFRLLREIEEK